MDQPTFTELEFHGKKRKTRRELFLERMDDLVHLAGFELQVIASLAKCVTAFHAASPRSMAKLSIIPLSLSRKWHWDFGLQAYAVQDHVLGRDPLL